MKGDKMANSKFQIPNSKLKNGQSLIEVIIGVGVAVMLAISLITTSLITQRTARSARNNTQATKMAQEYVEEIRSYRDRNGFSALADGNCITINKGIVPPASPTSGQLDPAIWVLNSPNPCIAPPGEKLGEKNILNGVIFYRALKIEANPAAADPSTSKLITATVKWDEPSGEKVVTSQTVLTKWEGLP